MRTSVIDEMVQDIHRREGNGATMSQKAGWYDESRGDSMTMRSRRRPVGVKVGDVQVGGDSPIVVQSMANTDTADVESTARQCIELARAGSELVRVTVNL